MTPTKLVTISRIPIFYDKLQPNTNLYIHLPRDRVILAVEWDSLPDGCLIEFIAIHRKFGNMQLTPKMSDYGIERDMLESGIWWDGPNMQELGANIWATELDEKPDEVRFIYLKQLLEVQ